MPYGPVLTAWDTIGNGTRMLLDILHPLSDALPVVMELDIPPQSATGASEVGFLNYGKEEVAKSSLADHTQVGGEWMSVLRPILLHSTPLQMLPAAKATSV